MTDRAPSGGTLPNACPFLALEEDRDRRSAVADGRHRCYAEPAPQPRALTYQETYCLSPAFAACRSFLDWAARAAAEPVTGQNRAVGAAAQPLAPIPAPATPPPAPPLATSRPPLNPVLPPAQVLPPPPAGYAPPPTWRPPAPTGSPAIGGSDVVPGAPGVPAGPTGTGSPLPPVAATGPGVPPPPGWQPPGTPPTDTTGFTWAVPPPWVAQPEMRTTAGLPDSARPPLDAERLGWTSAGRAGTLPPAPLDEEDTDGYPVWPPAPRNASVSGTFATRRSEPFAPLPAAGPELPGLADAPPLAALVAADLEPDLDVDSRGVPEAPEAPPVGPWAGEAHPAPSAVPAAAEASDDRWIGEDRATPSTDGAGIPSETTAWSTWGEATDPPDAWPQSPVEPAAWPVEPVAIKVGDGPSSVPSSGAAAWQGVMGDPAVAPAPVAPPDGTSTGRRGPSSRWLPSFLSRDPHEETGTTAVAARTGPAPALSASTVLAMDDPLEDGAQGTPAGPGTAASAAGSATMVARPEPSPTAPVARTATGAVSVVDAPAAAAAADEDPPGSLAPRRRRQRPGVPVDADAPTTRPTQTRPATRTKGSGEWNQSKTATSGSGRRFIPGGLPPLLLGIGALFLGALALFLLPGMLAGGGDAATPAPTIQVSGGIAASLGPDATSAPVETDPPSGEFQPYVVERGDTLIDIARRFSVSQEVLICANRELRRNPNLLSVGQELQIPPEDWSCPSQAKPTKKPGRKAPASEAPVASEAPAAP